MITSAKNHTKQTNKQKTKRTDRTLGQMVTAKLYRQNYTQKHTHTHSQKEKKGKIYVYHCSQSPPPQFGMICCLFRYSTDAGTSSWLWRFNPLLLKLLGEISLSLLCSHSSRGSWRCSSLRRAVCSPSEVVPGSRDPGSGGLHRLPGGEVWIVTCARTQASWWRQQQP